VNFVLGDGKEDLSCATDKNGVCAAFAADRCATVRGTSQEPVVATGRPPPGSIRNPFRKCPPRGAFFSRGRWRKTPVPLWSSPSHGSPMYPILSLRPSVFTGWRDDGGIQQKIMRHGNNRSMREAAAL
jgi:hypothetical protein